MTKPVQVTPKQLITLTILASVAVVLFLTTHKTPIQELRQQMIEVYVDHDNAVKDTYTLISKIVGSSKDSEKCAKMFNELFMPAVETFNQKSRVTTKKNMTEAIDIVITGIEKACK